MLESANYLASVQKGELVPPLTLNAFIDEENEWNLLEEGQIMGGVSFLNLKDHTTMTFFKMLHY